MKKIFSLFLFCLLVQTVWPQSGEGYDPQNPADPDVYYTLTLEAAPLSSASTSFTRQKFSAGQQVYVSAAPRLGYEFKQWMEGEQVVSTEEGFYYDMPERNVVLTAYYEWNPTYDPQNPEDPASDGYSHHVYVYSTPSAGGYFNTSNFMLTEGQMAEIYAYPREGFRFESWSCNGEVISSDNPLSIRMGTADISYVAKFIYNPVSPDEPSPNMFNTATGEVIIDNFTHGSLNKSIFNVVGSSDNYSLVQSITIIGSMDSSDFGFAYNFNNCSLIDISRTTGYTEVPSWSFEGMASLTKIILPASVERIGTNAFYGCTNISELYCYATTPPEIADNAFFGIDPAMVVKVPSSAIALYQKANGWKDFTILPVDEETNSIIVNLPSDAKDGHYKNMYVELENAVSMQTFKYLITDRQSYTFLNLIRNTTYNIRVKNASGEVLGEKEKVTLGEEDLIINFDVLLQPQTLTIKVLAPDDTDLTEQATITWIKEDGSMLAQGQSVNGVLEGTRVTYHIALPSTLAMKYHLPNDGSYTVKTTSNNITCKLETLQNISVSGKVLDSTTGLPVTEADIIVSQLINGKYTKSITTHTDKDGIYHLNIFNEQSSITVSANDYLSQSIEFANFDGIQQIGDISLKNITGAVITVHFTYTENVEAGQTTEVLNWYPDQTNVTYIITNKSQNKEGVSFIIQDGSIVLQEAVSEGDILQITARSRNGKFKDVIASVTIDKTNRAKVTFPIVEQGTLEASFANSENTGGVVGILYNTEGVLLSKTPYDERVLSISNIPDGEYTLVTMGNSLYFNTILNLSELSNAGLIEGRDFVKNNVTIKSGLITTLNIENVPTFNESQFYYTGESTSFSANKSQVTIGNYITLRAKVDFKDEYTNKVRKVKLIIDLPESCQFVDNSVLTGNGMGSYELLENRLVINMNSLEDLIRFCVIPTMGGKYTPNAFIQFEYNGENVIQPIGSAYFEAENLAISLPTLTADSEVVVNGTSPSDCEVKIYDEDVIIGTTRSLANGRWSARVNLNKPYSHSFHNVYAEVNTSNGQRLLTDTKLVEYDKTLNQLKTITMLYNGKTIVFDQIEGTTSTNTYSYNPSVHDFTFMARFSNSDTTFVKNLTFRVLLSDGTQRRINSTYSPKHDAWVGFSSFAQSSRLPVNVVAEYWKKPLRATISDQMEEEAAIMQEEYFRTEHILAEKAEINLVSSEEGKAVFDTTLGNTTENMLWSIEELDYESSVLLLDKMQFDFIPLNNGYLLRYIDVNADGVVMTIIDSEEKIALRFHVHSNELQQARASKNTINRKLIANLKRRWKNGEFLSDIKGVYDNILDFLELKKYITRPYFEMWCDLIINYMDSYTQISSSLTPLLTEKCPDGTLKLSREQITQFHEKRNAIDDLTSGFSDTYYDYLELYQMKLRNAVICEVLSNFATLGVGKVVGKLAGKTSSFIINKLRDRMSYGASLWLKNTVGLSFNMLQDQLSGIVNPLKESCDFENVGNELDSWGPEQNAKYLEMYDLLKKQIISSYKQCKSEDPDDSKDNETDEPQNPDEQQPLTQPLKPSIDPSGYVYEGVSSNRLQGVTATAYYMESTEDMYGVIHNTPKIWDAEEYAQANPLFTDENGMYQWDVPQGLWQVKFEKEGYETTYSEWLPVPPPQLDVNIAMKQIRQPEVKEVHIYKKGVEVEFDKYMLPTLLNTDNILISQNGEYVEGEIILLNEETAYDNEDEKYASKLRFVPVKPFTGSEVTLIVTNRVKSYAGLQMQDAFQQTFTLEQELTDIKTEKSIKVAYEGNYTLVVEVLPSNASAGKTLRINSSSPLIATTESDEYILDNQGKAEIIVQGELPGSAALTFKVDGYDLTSQTLVDVELVNFTSCTSPTANIGSGSIVDKGTSITLSCDIEGAIIYYTLDGSCPCNETDGRKIYDGTPIVINEDVTIKAMAVAPNMSESEVVEFVYKVKSLSIIPGDANGDGNVNVTDIVEIVNYILGHPSAKFNKAAADVNGDGEVNVTDIVSVVNIILSSNARELTNRAAATNNLKLSGASIKLRDAENYTAAQFDIHLSDGSTVNYLSLNSASDHQMTWKMVDANTCRVIVYSLSNAPFRAVKDELFNVTLSGNATISNELLVNVDGMVTGINEMQFDKPVDVYDLRGNKVRSNTTDLNGLQKGVYIVNGKKTIVK